MVNNPRAGDGIIFTSKRVVEDAWMIHGNSLL
jgi:hypothetical protein